MKKMKTLWCLSLMALLALPVCAQKAVGQWSLIPRVGATFSSISGDGIVYDVNGASMDTRVKVGVEAGVDVEYQLHDVVALSVGAFYQRLGCRYADAELSAPSAGTYSVWENCRHHIDYLSLPVMAHFYLEPTLLPGLAVSVGVQPQVKLSGRYGYQENEVTVGRDGSYNYSMGEDESHKSTVNRGFDLAIPVGISYERQRVVLDLRYQLGLLKAYKYGVDGKNWAVVLSAGYRI